MSFKKVIKAKIIIYQTMQSKISEPDHILIICSIQVRIQNLWRQYDILQDTWSAAHRGYHTTTTIGTASMQALSGHHSHQ